MEARGNIWNVEARGILECGDLVCDRKAPQAYICAIGSINENTSSIPTLLNIRTQLELISDKVSSNSFLRKGNRLHRA